MSAQGRGVRLRPRRLLAAPVAVLAVVAFAGAVLGAADPPSWLGWCPPWALAAAGAVLTVASTWLVEPWASRRRNHTDRERAALDQLAAHLGRGDRLPRLDEVDPLALRVHQAIPLPTDPDRTSPGTGAGRGPGRAGSGRGGVDPRLPVWVEREKAAGVRRWLQDAKVQGGLLVVVGDSSTGKTRLLYEVLREQLGGWAVLAPDLGDGGLVNTVAEATFPLPPLVVWLDELHRFLPGPYLADGATAVTAGAVRRLLDAPTPVVIAGALWPEHARELRAEDPDPVSGQRRPRWPAAAEVLDNRRRHEVTLTTFTPDERRAAARLAGTDPRLADAVADQHFGVTETLAGAPDLIRRYEQGSPTERAVLHAAADALRLGARPPLTDELLQATARAYLEHVEPDDTWYPTTRTALARARLATAPLLAVPDPTRHQHLGWTVADYLLQHLTRTRQTTVPPAAAWDALTHAAAPTDLAPLGRSAADRDLGRIAESLYRKAITTTGDPSARAGLAWLLEARDRPQEAEQVLRDAVTVGDPDAHTELAWLLEARDRPQEAEQVWRDAVTAGDPDARVWLAQLLERLDRPQDAEQVRRDAVTAGDPHARTALAWLLQRLDRPQDAEQVLRDAVTAGDLDAHTELARLLERLDRPQDAEQVLRDAVTAGDPHARAWLAELLERLGRLREAEQVLRDAVAAGDPGARTGFAGFAGLAGLAGLLERLGRLREVEQVLRDAVAAGDPGARIALAGLLERLGRPQDAVPVLGDAVAAGDPGARIALAGLLERLGRPQDAVPVLRDAVAAGHLGAPNELAGLLERIGRPEEADRVRRHELEPEDFTRR